MNSGQEVRLRCNDDGPVTWDFQNSDSSGKPRHFNNKEWYIKNASAKDTGRYICKNKESLNTSIYVFVKGKFVCVFFPFFPSKAHNWSLVCPFAYEYSETVVKLFKLHSKFMRNPWPEMGR